MNVSIRILFLCLFLISFAASATGVLVTYPADEIETDTRHRDLLEILKTALAKTEKEYGPYELLPSKLKMNEARYMMELKNGNNINIAWSSTSIQKEKELLPIRIPLRKGILGYRVLLISKDNQNIIDSVKSIEDLRKLTIGQGTGWGDVQIYESNGLKVVTSDYENLFKMISANRIDLFPRGVNEIVPEYEHYVKEYPNLAIEKNLLIYYPWPFYYFFNKKDEALRDRVEAGIKVMIRDGSFDRTFNKYNSKFINQLNIRKRRTIVLKNDLLPPDTPLENRSLWYSPN